MNLSDLQKKDIINMETGLNLGRIIDVEINSEGRVIRFIAEPRKVFRNVFKSGDTTIDFSNIVKIGSDVILVKWKILIDFYIFIC